MSRVDLVLTDTRIWARGPATHWDAPPSIVLGSNGNLVVGESLNPPTQVSSAVQFVPAERIALLPRVPAVPEALTAVFGTALENLGVGVPCERITLVCPTEWGGRRRAVLDAAARRFAHDVVFEEIAARAVTVDDGTARSRRTVVLEFGAITTTATAVTRSHLGVQVEACEHEPNLALADLGADQRALDTLTGLIARLLDGRPADVVQAVGVSDPVKLDLIAAAVQQSCGPDAELRPISGGELVRGAHQEPEYRPEAAPALPTNEWLQPLRERAAAQAPDRPVAKYVLAGVAVIAVIAAVVGGVVVAGGSDETTTAAPTSTTAAAATTTPAPVPPPHPTGAQETVGRIRFKVPDGWRLAPPSGQNGGRVDLSPQDGARYRMTLVQTPVAPNAGYEQIAANLEAQMKTKPSIGDLRRDVVFGGRSGLSYVERPEGSTVQWHVLVEHGIQVSIGCQYVGNTWNGFEPTCENFASSVHVIP
ncbi:type VII secretion-associated protein [Nocardia bhagyanarayanae]|uniref:Type VII secretion-associated protein (TIGR03931 family) n=1 Tax=Nocardia bhagyanarayanae TaxID=1215925 RepID=A0A543F4G7_9NOCA|nr:type VII secretion-associated protein [Nocardia bhagyanarayanae]TQM28711.1 type VII secretion-associated protein (TIGR03931 family) [Nocardia bhagyanarayanae]